MTKKIMLVCAIALLVIGCGQEKKQEPIPATPPVTQTEQKQAETQPKEEAPPEVKEFEKNFSETIEKMDRIREEGMKEINLNPPK